MTPDEYVQYDAVGLAELVRTGEVTPTEVLNGAIERMRAVNQAINAVVVDLEHLARAAIDSGLPEGPLHGVPTLLKDISTQLQGVRTTAGSHLFDGAPPADADSALVAAYKASGLNIFGKSNTPEFGLAPVTEPRLYGKTRNPWNLALTPGGSSGGAAAAVAAGIVPAAQASDGGGSIRIPAACCGLVGLKPSRGRISLAPNGEGWGGMTVLNAVSRTVRDSAMFLDISCAPQTGDPYALPAPWRPFLEEASTPPERLRIGFTTAALGMGRDVDAPCAEAVRDTARLCEQLGHSVEEVTLAFDFASAVSAGGVLVAANVADTIDREAERRGRPAAPEEVEKLTWLTYQRGQTVTGANYVRALSIMHKFGRELAGAFEQCDVILLSTLGSLPISLGALDANAEDFSAYMEQFYSFVPNTQAFNASGLPAISLPLSWSEDGLPIGLQFAAGYGREDLLFRLAGQLEEARPWRHRCPDLTQAAS